MDPNTTTTASVIEEQGSCSWVVVVGSVSVSDSLIDSVVSDPEVEMVDFLDDFLVDYLVDSLDGSVGNEY